MNEFDLIKRYLEKSGTYKLYNTFYYNEGGERTLADAGAITMGNFIGVPANMCFLFGNFSVDVVLWGAGLLTTDLNQVDVVLTTAFPAYTEPGNIAFSLCNGSGLYQRSDGAYVGGRRLYGVGFNNAQITFVDCAGANSSLQWSFNGYLFQLR